MITDLLTPILENTYSMQDLKIRIRLLRKFLENRLFGGQKEQFSPTESSWLQSLSPEFIQYFTQDNLYSSFKEIETQIKKLAPLTIYLSFDPPAEQIQALGEWFKKNLTQIRLFDIKIDPSLIGGIALVNKGVYKDYSLKSRIEQQGSEILGEFKKYVK